jgi:hypothetical protein
MEVSLYSPSLNSFSYIYTDGLLVRGLSAAYYRNNTPSDMRNYIKDYLGVQASPSMLVKNWMNTELITSTTLFSNKQPTEIIFMVLLGSDLRFPPSTQTIRLWL